MWRFNWCSDWSSCTWRHWRWRDLCKSLINITIWAIFIEFKSRWFSEISWFLTLTTLNWELERHSIWNHDLIEIFEVSASHIFDIFVLFANFLNFDFKIFHIFEFWVLLLGFLRFFDDFSGLNDWSLGCDRCFWRIIKFWRRRFEFRRFLNNFFLFRRFSDNLRIFKF